MNLFQNEMIILFLDLLCTVSCDGQSATFADLLTNVFVYYVYWFRCSEEMSPEPNLYNCLAQQIRGIV